MNDCAVHVNDTIRFVTMTPDGPLKGIGKVAAIRPARTSNWLHVVQDDSSVRMLLEATTKFEVVA